MLLNLLDILAWILVGSFLIIQIVGLYSLLVNPKPKEKPKSFFPKVSVLVAARNEENNLSECLQSLSLLNYPNDKLEILIGNDRSEDTTGKIADSFSEKYSHFKTFHLDGTEFTQTKGKARVLAFLANQAQGEYLFITDADIEINPEWINELLANFDENTALVSGLTMVKKNNLFASLQSIDWLYFMSLINGLSNINMGVTAVGNNMAVKTKAYKETGGYENMPFSITEDYKLYKTLREIGYKTRNLLTPNAVLLSKSIPTFVEWLHQRKRWLKGGLELPLFWKSILSVVALFYFAMAFIFFTHPQLWLFVWFAKFSLQSLQLLWVSQLLKQKAPSIMSILVYDLYLYIGMPLMALFFLYPGKVVWKGRKF